MYTLMQRSVYVTQNQSKDLLVWLKSDTVFHLTWQNDDANTDHTSRDVNEEKG